MMQNIHEYHCVECPVRERNCASVKLPHRYMGLASYQHVDPRYRNVWFAVLHQGSEKPISTAHIENSTVIGQERGNLVREHSDSPVVDITVVNFFEYIHLRFMPKMLMKKLDKTV